MPKQEWGTKRVCPTTGKRFYDLNHSPVISPYTGEVVDIDSIRRRAAGVIPEKDVKVAGLVEEDIDEDLIESAAGDDTELDDELLEDDGEESVSLDEIAEVAGGEDDV
ncbi:MAG: hypothetical protein RLZ26_1726 [Pseudomonadota bacterium]|jgi:uncharacterized protein (TIGR02300 family)